MSLSENPETPSTGKYWCWRCVHRPVRKPLLLCSRCQEFEARRLQRWIDGKNEQTAESTHERWRTDLENADKPNTGAKPKLYPEY